MASGVAGSAPSGIDLLDLDVVGVGMRASVVEFCVLAGALDFPLSLCLVPVLPPGILGRGGSLAVDISYVDEQGDV